MESPSGGVGVPSYRGICANYDRLHQRFLRYAGSGGQSAFEGAVLALLNPGIAVLDAASGTGSFAARLLAKSSGISLTLLDACPEMIARTPDLPVCKVTARLENMPFADDSFDLVTCAWGIEITDRPYDTVLELLRVTRRGGHVCLVSCADVPLKSVAEWIMKQAIYIRDTGIFIDPTQLTRLSSNPCVAFARRIPCLGPALAMVIKKAE